MLCIHWLVQLMHCLYKALFMSNKTVYSFSYNTAILVVIIFVLSYAARTHTAKRSTARRTATPTNVNDTGVLPGALPHLLIPLVANDMVNMINMVNMTQAVLGQTEQRSLSIVKQNTRNVSNFHRHLNNERIIVF